MRVTGSVKYKHLGPIGSKIVLKLKYYEASGEAVDILDLGELVGSSDELATSSDDLATLPFNTEYSSKKQTKKKDLLGEPCAKGVLLPRCVLCSA